MAIHLPAEDAAMADIAQHPLAQDTKVSAIEIYRRASPRARPVKAIWDVVQNDGPGSGAAQGDGENRGNSGDRGSARQMHNDLPD